MKAPPVARRGAEEAAQVLAWLQTQKLKSSDPRTRRAAVERLDALGAGGRLVPMAADADPAVRLAAVQALSRVPTRAAVEAVARATGDADAAVARAAVQAVLQLGSPLFDKLLASERGAVVSVVLEAVPRAQAEAGQAMLEVAGRIGANEAVEPLVVMLADTAPSRRAAATRALGEVLRNVGEDARALIVSALRPLLGDPDPHVQITAALTLAVEADDGRARNLLLECAHAATAAAEGVLSGASAEVSNAVRLDAIRGLGRLRDPATRAVLLAILRDHDAEVRGAACEALGIAGDARTIDVLRKLQMNDPDPSVKEKAKFAILEIRERRGIADA